MFFINNDDPKVWHGREHSRACANDDFCAAAERFTPGEQPFVVCQRGMQDRHGNSETMLEPTNELGCQANFGD